MGNGNAIDWLNEIITNPEGWQAFYSDSEAKNCAEETLALLREKDPQRRKVVFCNQCAKWDSESGLSARWCSCWERYTTQHEFCSRGCLITAEKGVHK